MGQAIAEACGQRGGGRADFDDAARRQHPQRGRHQRSQGGAFRSLDKDQPVSRSERHQPLGPLPAATHQLADRQRIEEFVGNDQQLPLRQVTLKIETLDSGLPYIRFDGQFGLLADDPFTLWRYLLARQRQLRASVAGIANDTSTTSTYGSFGQFTLQPVPDGTNKVFHTPNNIGFIAGTQVVTLNLLFQRPSYEYVVSNATIGQITFTAAPPSNSSLFAYCRTL